MSSGLAWGQPEQSFILAPRVACPGGAPADPEQVLWKPREQEI